MKGFDLMGSGDFMLYVALPVSLIVSFIAGFTLWYILRNSKDPTPNYLPVRILKD